ncbi:PREDICTED: uncharacterized protein LOC104990353 [Bison bison bison]|uniref:Uncharacterized protein LOC104990353 n=1 Tax=Bison bison bison TaxID=43346 RepID=A0A6P3HCF0_BISBB|nr:PREDICTED: uncharacterized protein LOC104990353 [Bison bison bison]
MLCSLLFSLLSAGLEQCRPCGTPISFQRVSPGAGSRKGEGGHKFPSPGDKAGSQAVPKLEGDAGLGPWSCQTWSSAAQVPLHGPRRRLCLPHSMRPTKSQLKQSPGSRIPLSPSQWAAFRLTSLNVRILFRGLSVLKHSRQKLSLEPGHGACPQSCAGGRWVTRYENSGRETEAGRPRRGRWVVPGKEGSLGWDGKEVPNKSPGSRALHAESHPWAWALVLPTVRVKCPFFLWAR